jgi:hypothetical protein
MQGTSGIMGEKEHRFTSEPENVFKGLCPKSTSDEKISRAKAQSAAAFLKGFLCAFAPLREEIFLGSQVLKSI